MTSVNIGLRLSQGAMDGQLPWRSISNGSIQWLNDASGGTTQSGVVDRTYQWQQKSPKSCGVSALKLVLANVFNPDSSGEVNGANSIASRNSVFTTGAKTLFAVGGLPTATLAPGDLKETDELAYPLAKDSHFYLDDNVQVASGQTFPIGPIFLPDFGQGFVDSDVTASGAVSAAAQYGYCPVAVLARTDTPALAVIGDSIDGGWTDFFSTDSDGNTGYFGRWLTNTYGQLKLAAAGERSDQFTTTGRRMDMLKYATHVLIGYGRIDLNGGRTAAQILSTLATIIAAIRSRYPHMPIFVRTIPPQATSTDGYATLGNQTVLSNNAQRVLYNAALPGLVAAGTIDAVVDITHAIENAGKWVPGKTDDGTHPNGAGHAAIAADLGSTLLHSLMSMER